MYMYTETYDCLLMLWAVAPEFYAHGLIADASIFPFFKTFLTLKIIYITLEVYIIYVALTPVLASYYNVLI